MSKPAAEAPNIWIDSNDESQWHWSRDLKLIGFNPIVAPLSSGDFRFIANGKLWVIERKRAPGDLESSFKDGRLQTQFLKQAENEDIERYVILIEGNPNQVMLGAAVKGTLLELQAMGVFVDYCEIGQVPIRLYEMYKFLCKDDHSSLRKPPLPMPTAYSYTDRDLRNRVQMLLTVRGIGEKPIVEVLRRYSLWEVLNTPELIREVTPSVMRGAIRNMYELMQREVPEMYQDTARVTRPVRKRTTTGVQEDMGEVVNMQYGAVG